MVPFTEMKITKRGKIKVLFDYVKFHPFALNVFVSYNVKRVSYKSCIVGSWIFIHSAYLCLLIGMFNPLIVDVINGKIGFTCTILLICFQCVLGHFVPLFPHIAAFYVKYFLLYYFNSLLFIFTMYFLSYLWLSLELIIS